MAKKSTKKSTKNCKDCGVSGKHRTWGRGIIVAICTTAIICVAATFALAFAVLKSDAMTDEQEAYLYVFPEVASEAVRAQDIIDGKEEIVEMTGYGISDEDGVFYIAFRFAELGHQGLASDWRTGKMYFWEDSENPGHYSHAFGYDD